MTDKIILSQTSLVQFRRYFTQDKFSNGGLKILYDYLQSKIKPGSVLDTEVIAERYRERSVEYCDMLPCEQGVVKVGTNSAIMLMDHVTEEFHYEGENVERGSQ